MSAMAFLTAIVAAFLAGWLHGFVKGLLMAGDTDNRIKITPEEDVDPKLIRLNDREQFELKLWRN